MLGLGWDMGLGMSGLGCVDLFCFRGVSVLDGASLSLLRLGPSVL